MGVGLGRVAGTVVALWLLMAAARSRPVQAGAPPCSSVPGLTGMPVTALAPVAIGDEAGVLVGTDRGLWLVRSVQSADGADVVNLPLPDGPTPVTALATSTDGAAWIATEWGVLYHPATCPGGADCPFRAWPADADELPFRTVLAVTPDGVIGGPQGVAQWDGQAWQQDPDAPAGVTALLRVTDSLWAATRAGDLWQRDPAGRWRSLPLPGQQPGRALLALDSLPGRLVVAGELGVWAINLDQEGKVQRVAHIADTPVAALVVEDGRSVLTGPATASSRGPSCQTVSVSAGTISLRQITLPGGEPITTLASFGRAMWVGTPRGLYVYGPPPRWAPAPPRLPVLLVPGLYGADDLQSSQLKFLARALRADGYPVVYVGSLRPDRPLEANARQLRTELTRVLERTGSNRAWIVGHSYGGLVAEAMVRVYGPEGVAGVATLGTPHAGMWLWADLLAAEVADGNADAGVADLLPIARGRWLEEMPPLRRLAVAGTLVPQAGSPLLSGLPAGDGLVAEAEALAVPGIRRALPLAHGWNLRLLELGVPALTGPQNPVYWDLLRPWMEQEEVPLAWRLPPPTSAPLQTPERWEAVVEGELPSSRVVTATLSLQAGDVRHVLITWRGGRPRTWLVDPEGERLADDRVPARDDVAVVPFEAVGLRPVVVWSVRAEADGTWRLVVQNEESRDTQVRALAVVPGAPGLRVRTVPTWGSPGQEVRVIVEVPGNALTEVRLRWLGEETPLRASGPGAFEGTLTLPRKPGLYAFEVRAGTLVRFVPVGVAAP